MTISKGYIQAVQNYAYSLFQIMKEAEQHPDFIFHLKSPELSTQAKLLDEINDVIISTYGVDEAQLDKDVDKWLDVYELRSGKS